MVTRTLTCENEECPFTVYFKAGNRESAESLYDYGQVNPTLGQAREFTCLLCGSRMKARKSLKVRLAENKSQ